MPPPRISTRSLSSIRSTLRPSAPTLHRLAFRPQLTPSRLSPSSRIIPSRPRPFSTTSSTQSWLVPRRRLTFKDPKGRPRVSTGGSTRGTTVIWGDYGLRLRDHDRRISARQLQLGEEVIRRRLRGYPYRIFNRFSASTAVYVKGTESRMGTGKGSFDHWAARVPVSRVVFEVAGDVHEEIVRDALRLAGNKLPGNYEFVKKGDAPVMGLTKLQGDNTAAAVMRPRRKIFPVETTAARLPGTNDGADPKSGVNPSPL